MFRASSSELTWDQSIAQVCEICGKGAAIRNNISHAHNITKGAANVNCGRCHAKVGAATNGIHVSTSCLKSGKVVKA